MKIYCLIIFLCILTCAGLTSEVYAEEQAAKSDTDFVYEDGGRRDPFWPLVNKGGGIISYDKDLLFSEMALQGIMVGNDGKNIAIINGIIAKEGDMLGLYLVKQVSSGSVILVRDQEILTLILNKEE